MTTFNEDGLSIIATKLGTLLMLDSYISDMCMQSWGMSSYVRAMIKLRADEELKDAIVVVMPKLVGEGFNMCTIPIELVFNKNDANTSGKKKQADVCRQTVSNSNSFDALNSIENDDDLGTNGENTSSAGKGVAYSSISITLITERIDKFERHLSEGKLLLVDDDGKPLPKMIPLNVDNETAFSVDKKIEFITPTHHDKPVRKSVSGCSRHMTGNIAYLLDFKEFDGGYVTFRGGAHGGRISSKDEGTSWIQEDFKVKRRTSADTEIILDQEEPTKLVKDLGSGEKGEKEISTVILEVSTAAENLVYIRRSAVKRKDKGKAIMKEEKYVQKKSKKIGAKLDEESAKRKKLEDVTEEEAAAEYEKDKKELRDLRMIFDPDKNDELWMNQLDWKLLRWKLHENYGVHTQFMDGLPMEINLPVEKKYPLIKKLLEKMLNL
uniref:Uncharacterized protein n=1 Tax=Tanacetum cinerariifolium TaxID=118510 RepID=A0A699GK20_TANCI|nr:hypothetical protein [Tanacetum cinerariifolium]